MLIPVQILAQVKNFKEMGFVDKLIGCVPQAAQCSICVTGYLCDSCSNAPDSSIIGAACPCNLGNTYSSGSCVGKNLEKKIGL